MGAKERSKRVGTDSVLNTSYRDIIGSKGDAAAAGAVSTTESLMAYLKQLVGLGIARDVELDVAPQTAKTGTVELTGGSVTGIFTIAGGPILVDALIGEIIEVVSANACAAKLIATPTNGAATDMCATVDINAFLVNGFLTIDGTIASAMVNAEPATALPLGIGMDIPLCLPIGTIDMDLANSNPTTGQVVWYLRYRPLATGVTVAAVA